LKGRNNEEESNHGKRQDRFDEEIFLGLFLISMSGLHFGNPLVVFFAAI
jgi:hypothetical protein